MQTPTLRDVADAAGVHPATASRALNPATRGLVNADTARRVIKVAESLGYRPNPIARGLKTSKSGTVGLVIPDLTNPLFPPIVRGIEDVLEPAGYSGLIVNTDNDPGRERAQIELLRSRQVEGLIVATALVHHPLLEQMQREGVLMVMVNRRPDGIDVPSITPDDAAGVRAGRPAPRGPGPPSDRPPGRSREHLDGCGAGALVPQRRPRPRSRRGPRAGRHVPRFWSEASGAEALRGLLDADARFTAIVAGNDLIALGCYDVFAERGIDCPGHVSVVGFNDMPFLDKLAPPLTTIAIPHQQIGAEAARLLLDTIAEPNRPARSVQLPLSLVVRGSTAPPPR